MSDFISRSQLLKMLKDNKAEHTDVFGNTRKLISIDINWLIEYVEKMPDVYEEEDKEVKACQGK